MRRYWKSSAKISPTPVTHDDMFREGRGLAGLRNHILNNPTACIFSTFCRWSSALQNSIIKRSSHCRVIN